MSGVDLITLHIQSQSIERDPGATKNERGSSHKAIFYIYKAMLFFFFYKQTVFLKREIYTPFI